MRDRISVPALALMMKSFAPAARARFLVASSSSPEITITGIVLMRGSWELRMRSSRAKPSSLGIWMSENTTTIEGSVGIACQPASPSASSRTSKLLRIRREIVVRTIRESSTSSTRCLEIVVAGLALISIGHVDHDPALRRALDEGVEDLRELVEGYGAGHVLQVGGPQVAREPPPHFPAKRHGGGSRVDPQQAHAPQDERRDRRVEAHARGEADRGDGSADHHSARHPGQHLPAEVVHGARPDRAVEGLDLREVEALARHHFLRPESPEVVGLVFLAGESGHGVAQSR